MADALALMERHRIRRLPVLNPFRQVSAHHRAHKELASTARW